MHLRRALLLFALVLGLTALAAAVSPSREKDEPPVPPAAAVAGSPPGPVAPRTVAFRARSTGRPPLRRARAGEHLVVTVASGDGGLATIPQLGRIETVSPAAPARFDLLAPAAGRYDVMLQVGAGPSEPRRVGTLLTRP
jgi:hypothetical protein